MVLLSLELISHKFILELLVMPAQSYRMSCSEVFLWYIGLYIKLEL